MPPRGRNVHYNPKYKRGINKLTNLLLLEHASSIFKNTYFSTAYLDMLMPALCSW